MAIRQICESENYEPYKFLCGFDTGFDTLRYSTQASATQPKGFLIVVGYSLADRVRLGR